MNSQNDPVFQMLQIGASLGETRSKLLETLEIVASLSGGNLTKRAASIRARVRNSSVRIGVIGQVKAGKSSTINALTRRIGLLPSDVNPWTTVVTRLHFGHVSGKSSGAVFRFFNDAEWDRLANRGGRLGELTEGLLEDYKREKLAEQVQAMRARAEQRLGHKFAALLGKAHRFDDVSHDLLVHYVAAGDDPDAEHQNPTVGRFADITHSAEIYFPQAPFGYPLTLIDTPGVNDPLLIREEITQQSIENSDHFIVILSAHQTLNRSDMRLIRLLKALNRDRFVVFVNRLDEIRDPAGEYDRLRTKLVDHLRRELDGKEISVVLGSAAWANFALTGNEDLLDRDSLARFVQARGLADPARALDPDGRLEDPARAQAYLASGMPELMQVVSEMVQHGSAARTLTESAADLKSVLEQAVERAQLRLEMSAETAATFQPIATPDQIADMIAIVESRVADARNALNDHVSASFTALLSGMADAVDQFNRAEAENIRTSLSRARRSGEVTCDVDPLRRELELVIIEGVNRLRGVLIRETGVFEAALRRELLPAFVERMSSTHFGTTALAVLQPQMDALYRTISVELSLSWLSRIFGSANQKLESVQKSVKSQFKTICTDIVVLNQASFVTVIDRITEEFATDAAAQVTELAALTPGGDFYSPAEAESREEMRTRFEADLSFAKKLLSDLPAPDPLLPKGESLRHDPV